MVTVTGLKLSDGMELSCTNTVWYGIDHKSCTIPCDGNGADQVVCYPHLLYMGWMAYHMHAPYGTSGMTHRFPACRLDSVPAYFLNK